MKKIIIAGFLTFVFGLQAQNKEIQFEHGNLASVFEKAKKENKLIFIDAYTTWCGPCKWMAKNIFTNDTVADYYNTSYINYKLDMEKGEGLEFAKKYNVSCYPNLIVLNSSGELVHRGAGGLPVESFLAFGKNGYSSDKNFTAIKTNYEKEKLNEATILSYAQLLRGCCLDPSNEINNYLANLNDKDYLKRTNWVLFRDYINNFQSKPATYFIANYSTFENSFGKDTVEGKMLKLGKSYFGKFIYAKEYDKTGYENAKAEFTKSNYPMSESILINSDLSLYQKFDTEKYYPLAAEYHLKHSTNNAAALNQIAWQFYEKVSDKKLLEDALKMSRRACELKAQYMYEDTQAAILFKLEKYSEAEQVANKAIASAKKEEMSEDEYKETIDLLNKIKTHLK
ncbi:MAG: thioredoxin family protein [Sphingobacteriaceae bacterium]|nr:thioredoxin family protein [Sphingobacteriaceae bacterium]